VARPGKLLRDLDEIALAELVVERHLALVRLDDLERLAPALVDPVGELLRFADRRRQDDELRARVEPDDRLLPDVAALGVVEVVPLVHDDDVGGLVDAVAACIYSVPQDLGDDYLYRRLGADLV